LSKYTLERLPDDSTKSPCSSEAATSRLTRSPDMPGMMA
jgi:hypothetical protein